MHIHTMDENYDYRMRRLVEKFVQDYEIAERDPTDLQDKIWMEYAESFGFGVVRDLVGHGIGTEMHEAPEIPNFAQRRKGIRLAAGMTLAIEPMITAGRYDVVWEDDGWTVVTEDGSLASHYENTILITDGEPEILSL